MNYRHIDNYISPTSWTDLGMDWSKPDAQDARYVDALVFAIKERYKALGTNWVGPAIRPDMRLDYSKLMTIHNATLALVPRFVNHADSTGDWSGKTSMEFAPAWNIKSCLASFGDTVLLSPQKSILDNSVWLMQQYKILNKMDCIKKGLVHWESARAKSVWGGDSLPAGAKNDAEKKYASAEWINNTTSSIGAKEGWFNMYGTIGAAYAIILAESTLKIVPSEILTSSLKADINAFIKSKKPDVSDWSYYTGFDACGTDLIENEYISLLGIKEATNASEPVTKAISLNRPNPPPTPPPLPGTESIYDYQSENGFSVVDSMTIVRFYFAFRDWE